MAAPMATRYVRQILCCQALKSTLFTDAISDGQYRTSLALMTARHAHRRHGLYSLSSSDNSNGKAPLKKPYTPTGKHDNTSGTHRDAEKEPLETFPDNINPITGEKGGPRGPEPTRYGDWERKGRCIDF